jgi:hypothetical protein
MYCAVSTFSLLKSKGRGEPLLTGDLCHLSFALQDNSLFQKEKRIFSARPNVVPETWQTLEQHRKHPPNGVIIEALQPVLSELCRRAFGIAPQLSFCLTFYQGKHTSAIENSIDFFLRKQTFHLSAFQPICNRILLQSCRSDFR